MGKSEMKPWEKYQQESSPWEKYQGTTAPQKPTVEQKPKLNYLGQEYIEPALNIATRTAAPVIAGATSAVMTPFIGMENAAGFNEQFKSDLTYEPRLASSKADVAEFDRYMGNTTRSLLGTLPGQGVQYGVEQGSRLLNLTADAAADNFGPGAGAAVKTLPAAASIIPSLKLFGAARPPVKLLDIDGNPTPQLEALTNNQGKFAVQNATPQTTAMIPAQVEPGLIQSAQSRANKLGKDLQVTQIESGGRDASLARYDVENGRRVKNKQAIGAINKGWEEGTVRMAATSNTETKRAMNKMLEQRYAILKNESNATKMQPLDVVGDAVNDRVQLIKQKANQARIDLDRITKSNQFKSKQVDVRPIVQTLKDELDRLGVRYSLDGGRLNLRFDAPEGGIGSVIELNKKSQKAIQEALSLLRFDRPNTAESIHQLKKQLDDLIDFKRKSKGGISEEGRRVLKALRHQTNEVLRNSVDGYGEVNDILHQSLTALDDFSKASKVDLFFFEDPSSRIGEQMRKIISRYRAGGDIKDAADQLDRLASSFGGEFSTDYNDLVLFANKLDKRFGSSKSGDIQGKFEASDAARTYITEGQAGLLRRGVDKVAEKFQNLEKDQFEAYLSMKELLRR